MTFMTLPRHFLPALAMAAVCTMASPVAQAASVTLAPTQATITIDASLQALIGLAGATTSATGSGAYAAGVFTAAISSASVPGTGPGPVVLNWEPDAGLKFSNALASFTFSGLSFDAATSLISADILFESSALTKTYSDVGFLSLTGLTGSVDANALTSVFASLTPSNVTLNATAYLSIAGLSSVITDLGITSLPVTTDPLAGTVAVTSMVPEPGALLSLLAGLGLVAGVAASRRRTR